MLMGSSTIPTAVVESHQLVTFPQSLQQAGYQTAFVGKWHMGNDNAPRNGFDEWVCLKGQGSSFDPELNVNGRGQHEKGHVTDVLHRYAVGFLRQEHTRPFLLYFSHKALHPETIQRADGSLSDPNASTFLPAPRHQHLFEGQEIPRRENATESPQGKPALQRTVDPLPPLGPNTGSTDESILGRLRMLVGVDESLGELLRILEESNQFDRTLIVVTSDHGYFYGEHGLSVERRLAYEEAIRIPLLMRLPSLIKPGMKPDEIVLTLDLTPTLLELGKAVPPKPLPGLSLLPLLSDRKPTNWRKDFLIEYFSDQVFARIDRMGYQAVRTDSWKLIDYTELQGMDELYHLDSDPFEMKNLIAHPEHQTIVEELRTRLRQLLATSGG